MPFLLMVFLLIPLLLQGVGHDFYVWQRSHGAAVENAVQNYYKTCSGKLYFLAGEMENNGRTVAFPPEKFVDLSRSVPVVRIHIKHMKKTPAVLAGELVKLYQPWKETGEFQIDLDAPESKILYYQQLVSELRRRLPGVKLSVTVLPCHLRHTEAFRGLAKACDYYVLQVHALTNDGSRWFILDRATAFQALKRAKNLKFPFKTALPFYSNVVCGGIHVQPDMDVVGKLALESPGVIGFRLGVAGEEDTLDLQTALKICRGEKYSPYLEFYWERQVHGVWHFCIRNNGFFPKDVTFDCRWKKKISYLNIGMFNGAKFSADQTKITFRLPPSGTGKPFFWIRSEDPEKSALFTIQNRGLK